MGVAILSDLTRSLLNLTRTVYLPAPRLASELGGSILSWHKAFEPGSGKKAETHSVSPSPGILDGPCLTDDDYLDLSGI